MWLQEAALGLVFSGCYVMKLSIALLSMIVLFAGFGSSATSAGMVLSFGASSPAPLLAGSSGTLDVLIHSDASDVLDAFQVAFTLTPVGLSPVGGLQFSATQLDSQLTDPTYVFDGRSLSVNTLTDVGSVNPAGTIFTGFDATDDGSGSPLAGNPWQLTLTTTDQLLFRLNLDGVIAGTYQIAISSATFVIDQLGNPTDPSNQVTFSSDAGTITVADIDAVPEPSSAAILGLAAAFGIVSRRFRNRGSSRERT